MSKPAIGFIGLGLMGSAMVQRLLDLDYPMHVIANRSRENVDAAVARGATEHTTSKDLAAASDIVMLCMDTSANVEARMQGEDGVIAGLREGTVVVDFGTSLPGSTRMLGEKVAAAGGALLDAPLGRTPTHGRDGMLNIMGSGDKEAFDKVKPALDDLGENVFHLGALGTGHTIKLINNFFGMTVANAMAEAFAMADKADVDRKALYDVMSAGPLHSGMMDFVSKYALEGDPSGLAFAIKNARKDVGYYSDMAEDMGVKTLMGNGARDAMGAARDEGHGDEMVSQMVDWYAKKFST